MIQVEERFFRQLVADELARIADSRRIFCLDNATEQALSAKLAEYEGLRAANSTAPASAENGRT